MALSNESEEIINTAALKAAGLGVPGSFFPPLDIVGMSYIWFKLIRDLAKESGHKLNVILATKFLMSVMSGAALYLGGSKLLNSLLHAIPGAGNVTAASTNAVFNWIYTLRLGKLLGRQFSQPDFDRTTLLVSASGIAGLVFAIPTSGEVSEAFSTIGELLGLTSDAGTVADAATAGTDLLSSATEAAGAAVDTHALADGGYALTQEALRFGGAHPLEALIHAAPDFQREGMEKILSAAQKLGNTELINHIQQALDGKRDIVSAIKEARGVMPLSEITKLSLRFKGSS
jgi:uncharacterized protein (DUF697 family)